MASLVTLFSVVVLVMGALVFTMNMRRMRTSTEEQRELFQRRLTEKEDRLHACKKSFEESKTLLMDTQKVLDEQIRRLKIAQNEEREAKLELEEYKEKDEELADLKEQLQQAEERENALQKQFDEAKETLTDIIEEAQEEEAAEMKREEAAQKKKARTAKA